MAAVFTFLWNQVPGFLFGTVVYFYASRVAGKQIGYFARLVLHPMRLLHHEWLCPQCLGTGHMGEGPIGELATNVCFFCLRHATISGCDMGYTTWRELRTHWDWRHWHQGVRYDMTIPQRAEHGGRKRHRASQQDT